MPHARVLQSGPPNPALDDLGIGSSPADDLDSYAPSNENKSPASPPKPLMRRATVGVQISYVHEHILRTPGLEPESISVKLDTAVQHTLTWDSAITAKGVQDASTLPSGSCNLYLFPNVTLSDGRNFIPEGGALDALKQMILGLAADSSCELLKIPDLVGAFPVHAIAVCNTEEALLLVEQLCAARPDLLLAQLHTDHRDGFPLFTGESNLHVFAVNKREDLLCRLIDMATATLSQEDAKALFSAQAAGVFFNDHPMASYGSTLLAYACSLDLRNCVHKLLDTGLVSLNNRSSVCSITGYMPLHAVVANGHTSLYDWLTTELPADMRADASLRTSVGRLKLNSHGLLPMQLAAVLGDHTMVKHLMRKQCSINWVWGAVTEYSMSLSGIDSSGDGGGDIMELVSRVDANLLTTELLLDSFMTGFIYRLFQQKWKLYGWIHFARIMLDFAILALIVTIAFVLKADPNAQPAIQTLAIVELVLMSIAFEEEVRICYLWWLNNQSDGDAKLSKREMFRGLRQFVANHAIPMLLWSYLFNTVSCVIVLTTDLTQNTTDSDDNRLVSLSEDAVPEHGEYNGLLWLSLMATIFPMMQYFAFMVFTPFASLNIFLLSVAKMLKRDMAVFLLLYGFFLADFFIALYVVYPSGGATTWSQVEEFNSPYNALKSLVLLSFTGSAALINLDADFSSMTTTEIIDFVLFIVCGSLYRVPSLAQIYLVYTILSLILLLNLLIAMLSFTFESVRNASTLQCRTSFAQAVIRLELIAMSIGMKTGVGEKKGGQTVYTFRTVEGGSGSSSGSSDPFAMTETGPLDRIEDKLTTSMAKMEAQIATLQARFDAVCLKDTPPTQPPPLSSRLDSKGPSLEGLSNGQTQVASQRGSESELPVSSSS